MLKSLSVLHLGDSGLDIARAVDRLAKQAGFHHPHPALMLPGRGPLSTEGGAKADCDDTDQLSRSPLFCFAQSSPVIFSKGFATKYAALVPKL